MSTVPSIMPYNEAFIKGAPRLLSLVWNISGAVTVASRPLGMAPSLLVTFGAIASQSVIDTFLGTTDEFSYLAFDATSMGTDAMGVIVNMKGQAGDLLMVQSTCSTGATTVIQKLALKSSTLTDTSLTTEAALGADGNLAYKVVWANSFDGFTSGMIRSDLYFIAK